MTTITMDATGVISSGNLPVADFNETRKNAARSEQHFFERGTARSHGCNVTYDKTKHAPNSFRHSESTQIKNAINFSVWRNLSSFRKQMKISAVLAILITVEKQAAYVKIRAVKIFAALCTFTPVICSRWFKTRNLICLNAALTASLLAACPCPSRSPMLFVMRRLRTRMLLGQQHLWCLVVRLRLL